MDLLRIDHGTQRGGDEIEEGKHDHVKVIPFEISSHPLWIPTLGAYAASIPLICLPTRMHHQALLMALPATEYQEDISKTL